MTAYKITRSNHPRIMLFYPIVSTGKERDEETGYGYFGARYMDHELMTMWLSVDPMADKYPSMSPYAYCAWNPVKLVDPDGMEVYITGDAAEQATNQLSSKGITVTRDEKTGQLSYTKTGEKLTASDKQLIKAIESKDVKVNVYATNANTFEFEGEKMNNTQRTGQFLGVSVSDCKRFLFWETRTAETNQLVNPNVCEQRDKKYDAPLGVSMRHEITESFHAGEICRKKGISCGPCWDNWNGFPIDSYNHVYYEAHNKATLEAKDLFQRTKAQKRASARDAGIKINLLNGLF